MNLDNFKTLLRKHEGIRVKPYKCTAGKWTIGVGHNYQDNPLPSDMAAYLADHECLTMEHVLMLLNEDAIQAVSKCEGIWPNFYKFSENRQLALADWVFQLGASGVKGFKKANYYLNKQWWDLAAKEMLDSKWAVQTPNRARDITDMIREG